MVDLFKNFPNTYFRLNVDQGMQEIKFSEWKKLSDVEAHTTQYMNRKEVNAKLGFLVNGIRVSRGQITIEQLSTDESPINLIRNGDLILLLQFLLGLQSNHLRFNVSASSVHFQSHHLQDEGKF
jgi:hypothetical protein